MVPDTIEPLATERLVLRLVEASDAAAIHRYRGDPSITHYLSHGPLTGQENRDRLTEVLALRKASGGEWFNYGWAITLRDSGEVIGDARTWNTAVLAPPVCWPLADILPTTQCWATSCIRTTSTMDTAARLPGPS